LYYHCHRHCFYFACFDTTGRSRALVRWATYGKRGNMMEGWRSIMEDWELCPNGVEGQNPWLWRSGGI